MSLYQIAKSTKFATSPDVIGLQSLLNAVLVALLLFGYRLVLRERFTCRKIEARKTAIIEASLDCIITMDHQGRIIEFNPAAEKTFGYPRKYAIGQEMAQLIVPPRLHEAHRQGLAHFLNTGNGPVLGKKLEMPAIKADGTEFLVELSIAVLQLEGPPVFTGFLRDLSSERMTKQRLATQFHIMSALSDANSLKDATKKILQIIAEDLNWDMGTFWIVENQAKALKAIEIWHRTNINAPELIRITREEKMPFGKGLPGSIWKSGEPAWISNIADDINFTRCSIANKEGLHGGFGFPIKSGNRVLGIVEFFSRKTRSFDHDLLQDVTTLGGQIGQFIDRLVALENLQKTIGERDEFLSIASHELKTPLTTLSLQLQMLERSLRTAPNQAGGIVEAHTKAPRDKIKKTVKICGNQAKKLSELLDELLDLTRIRLGRLRLDYTEVDLFQVTQEVIDRFSAGMNLNQKIDVRGATGIVKGHWDSTRIEQIITNLISNAIKYGEGGHIEVDVIADPAMQYGRLIVKDHGMGIPVEMQVKIFERFERAVGPSHITGLGLGLYITRQIVEAHGGSISVHSEVGKGSTFTVALPLEKNEAVA